MNVSASSGKHTSEKAKKKWRVIIIMRRIVNLKQKVKIKSIPQDSATLAKEIKLVHLFMRSNKIFIFRSKAHYFRIQIMILMISVQTFYL